MLALGEQAAEAIRLGEILDGDVVWGWFALLFQFVNLALEGLHLLLQLSFLVLITGHLVIVS